MIRFVNNHVSFVILVVLFFQLCIVRIFVDSGSMIDGAAAVAATIIADDHNNDCDNHDETIYIYKDQFKDIRRQIDEEISSSIHTIKGITSSDTHHRRMKESIDPKLGQTLTTLVNIHNTIGPLTRTDSLFSYESVRMISDDTVLVDIVGKDDVLREIDNNLYTALLKDGYTVINCEQNMCSMYVLVDQLVDLSSLNYIHFIRAAVPITRVGSATSEGDIAMLSDQVRSTYNVNGSGLLIGVLSDSYNCLNGASQDIGTNDLPSSNNIIILSDLSRTECTTEDGIDEGRAMMQLIYDIAPGARLAFYTASRGEADFAAGIRQLANTGCDVIVDDIGYFTEPFYQDGIITQAVDDVVSSGVLYFSAIGNDGMSAWDAPNGFERSNVSDTNGEYHRFGTASNNDPIIYQLLSIPNDNSILRFNFQWSDRYYSVSGGSGSTSDLDIYFFLNNVLVARGINNNIGQDPIELIALNPSSVGSTAATINVRMYIQLFSGSPPKYMKLIDLSGTETIFEYGAPGTATGYGHANADLGAGVGAAAYSDTPAYGVAPPRIELYSSFGGTPIVYDKLGNLLTTSIIRKQPRVTGPDGGITTFFGDQNNRFFGTSAAAPHVAAVAALILQGAGGRRSLTPAAVYKILQDTAVDMNDVSTSGFDVGFDFNTGYGLVNALAALQVVRSIPTPSSPVKSPISAPVVPPVGIPVPFMSAPLNIPTSPVTTPISAPRTAPVQVPIPVAATPNSTPIVAPVPVRNAPVSNPVNAPLPAPVSVTAPFTTPVQVPIVPSISSGTKTPTATPIVAPVNIPAQVPIPVVPVRIPVQVPVPTTTIIIIKDDCGLFGLNLFCPFTFCGFFGRLFNLC